MSPLQANPQHLLTTLLGNYFFGHCGLIPSGLLVRLLGEFDVAEVPARNALSRVARRGLLEMTRHGRRTSYALSAEAQNNHAVRLNEIVNFGRISPDWDRTWSVVMFSVPEGQRALRHVLRSRLSRLRFGMLYDGVWVRPGPIDKLVLEVVRSVEPVKATVFVSAEAAELVGDGDPMHAFALPGVAGRYEQFITEHAETSARARDGQIGAAEALRVRTTAMDEWRELADSDPALPTELLPADWPLGRARQTFLGLYDGLADLADHRLRTLVEQQAPDLLDSPNVRAVSSVELADLVAPDPGRGPRTGEDELTAPITKTTR